MLRSLVLSFVIGLGAVLTLGAQADTIEVGGDLYLTGADGVAPRAGRDLFAAGFTVAQGAGVAEDAHLAGFRIDLSGPVGGDLYAAGGSVTLAAQVGADASIAAASVELTQDAEVRGNLRLSAGAIRIEGPVGGALLASGGKVVLNAPIAGDAWIAAGSVTFGPQARIGGRLHLATTDRPAIPASVVAQDRIVWESLDRHARRVWNDVGGDWSGPGPWTRMLGGLVGLAFFLIAAAVALTVAPGTIEGLRLRAMTRPLQVFLAGVLGLSALVGLIPVAALTIVGIPLLPFVLVLVVLAWTLGYMQGVYTLSMRLFINFGQGDPGPGPSLAQRLTVLAAGIVVTALINFIPVLGWIANVVIMLLGLGAMTAVVLERLAALGAGRS